MRRSHAQTDESARQLLSDAHDRWWAAMTEAYGGGMTPAANPDLTKEARKRLDLLWRLREAARQVVATQERANPPAPRGPA